MSYQYSALVMFQQADMSKAMQSESDYEGSIEAYKETPLYNFLLKWKRRRQVQKKKKALRGANKLLRSHYYVRVSNENLLDVRGNEIVYELGIHVGCIGYIINNC